MIFANYIHTHIVLKEDIKCDKGGETRGRERVKLMELFGHKDLRLKYANKDTKRDSRRFWRECLISSRRAPTYRPKNPIFFSFSVLPFSVYI